ncbi:MAG: EAL domain-containing protein, partial [Pseudomonadota bacterium]
NNSDGDTVDNNDDLKSILQSATDHLRCAFTALIVPEKSLVVLRTADGLPADTSALARTHRHLISLAQIRREPVILNKFPQQPGAAPLPYRVLSCPVRHPSGRASGVLALFRAADAPEFVEREARLADLLARRAAAIIEASYDAVTGLLTRPAFEQRARAVLTEARSDRKWSGLYIDTDQMHVVNENFGMHVGDRLIAKLGELIRARLVPGGFAARISGDRFAILLPSAAEDAVKFAESLREGAAAINGAGLGAEADSSLSVSVSIGVAAILDLRVEFAHAFAVAETACKAAKDRGRNRVELYQASDLSIVRRYEDINIAPNLRLAITENRLRLDAQMILPLTTAAGSRPHFELLLRMIDDDGNTVGPDRFLSAAVRYQLMPTVDRWVIQQAVDLLKPHAALLADRPVVFTINFSGQSLSDPDFPDFVVQTIERSGLNPAVFCFELTESAAVANLAKAEVMIHRLHALGCAVALDDFGTGLSSLSYLRQLPVDILKIDGSFVRDILKDPRADSMVEAIAHLARAMKLTTVAEYVETDEIRIRVAALGVDYGQGFAIARPSPLVDLLQELPMYATARSVDCTVRGRVLPVDTETDMFAISIEAVLADDAPTLKAPTPSESAISRYASRG